MTHEEAMNEACGVLFEGMNNNTLGPALESAIKAYLFATDMVIVPSDPTEQMMKSALDKAVYKAYLADAPNPFKSKP